MGKPEEWKRTEPKKIAVEVVKEPARVEEKGKRTSLLDLLGFKMIRERH